MLRNAPRVEDGVGLVEIYAWPLGEIEQCSSPAISPKARAAATMGVCVARTGTKAPGGFVSVFQDV